MDTKDCCRSRPIFLKNCFSQIVFATNFSGAISALCYSHSFFFEILLGMARFRTRVQGWVGVKTCTQAELDLPYRRWRKAVVMQGPTVALSVSSISFPGPILNIGRILISSAEMERAPSETWDGV